MSPYKTVRPIFGAMARPLDLGFSRCPDYPARKVTRSGKYRQHEVARYIAVTRAAARRTVSRPHPGSSRAV
jgi:hypothetical protein